MWEDIAKIGGYISIKDRQPLPKVEVCVAGFANRKVPAADRKLPFSIEYNQTSLSRIEAGIVAAMLDAAVRIVTPAEVKGTWKLSCVYPLLGCCFYIRVALKVGEFLPLVRSPARARISCIVCNDEKPLGLTGLLIKMSQSPDQQLSLIMTQFGDHDTEFLSLAVSQMLNKGIAPDRGSVEVLEIFYGTNGLVDFTKEQHRLGASAALKRNPDLREIFVPDLTAALL